MFFPNKPFLAVERGLNITGSRRNAKQHIFLAKPSKTTRKKKIAHGKHIQIHNLIELMMTNLAPTEGRPSMFWRTHCPPLIMAPLVGKCPLTLLSCVIKVCFHTCGFLVINYRGQSHTALTMFLLIALSLMQAQTTIN